MANLNNVIKINKADYTALVAAGSAGYVINGVRYYYDANTLYLVEDPDAANYAVKNANNNFTVTQTITNPNGSSDADICLNLNQNNTSFPNNCLIACHYNGVHMGSIGIRNTGTTSSPNYIPTFWHPTRSFHEILTDETVHIVQGYYDSSTSSWYLVWSNNWCMQGGITKNIADYGARTVYLLKTFQSTNYVLTFGGSWNGTNDDQQWIGAYTERFPSRTSSSFVVYSRSGTTKNVSWMACGPVNL